MINQLFELDKYLPSPIDDVFYDKIKLSIKRDDLIDPFVSGNKWRKLKGHILQFDSTQYKGIITCGGPWSNHIRATAALCNTLKIKAIGIVRGDYHNYENDSLKYCRSVEMDLEFWSNKDFDKLIENPTESMINAKYQDYFFIPLGGEGTLGELACGAIYSEIKSQLKVIPDAWFIPSGTGTTASGIIQSIKHECDVFIFPAINKAEEISILKLKLENLNPLVNVHYLKTSESRFGKTSTDEHIFINDVFDKTGVQFDTLYNGKMLYSLFTHHKDLFNKYKTPLILHTGGVFNLNS